jgi:hypothetical protein
MNGAGLGTTAATFLVLTVSGEPCYPMTSALRDAAARRRWRMDNLDPYPVLTVYRGQVIAKRKALLR